MDRCFNMEFGYWDENFTIWPLFVENRITNNDEADIFFNFDKIKNVVGNTWLSPVFENKVVKKTGDSIIMMNADGLLAEIPKDKHGTIPHYIKASIITPDDWKRCKEERMRRGDPLRRVDIRQIQ